jgi:hypothetical protein
MTRFRCGGCFQRQALLFSVHLKMRVSENKRHGHLKSGGFDLWNWKLPWKCISESILSNVEHNAWNIHDEFETPGCDCLTFLADCFSWVSYPTRLSNCHISPQWSLLKQDSQLASKQTKLEQHLSPFQGIKRVNLTASILSCETQ